ncbi:Uncharacterised protein [Yersinia enterocolitica]|nr:Uncharacterised protein [Yersinia enterocolitica]
MSPGLRNKIIGAASGGAMAIAVALSLAGLCLG